MQFDLLLFRSGYVWCNGFMLLVKYRHTGNESIGLRYGLILQFDLSLFSLTGSYHIKFLVWLDSDQP